MKTEVIIRQDNLRNGSKSRIRRIDYETTPSILNPSGKQSDYYIEVSHDEGISWEVFNICSGYYWVETSYRQVTRGSR